MSHHTFARLFVTAAVAVTLGACSSQVPVAPGELISTEQASANAQRAGVPGVYTISFWALNWTTLRYEEVSSLIGVPSNVTLQAVVEDTLGNRATEGTVTFEYCSYGGRRYDSIQPDGAPTQACEQGLATWTRLWNAPVVPGDCRSIGGGSVCRPLTGCVPITVGLRFTFTQGKGTIAGGSSAGRDFVWVAAQ